MRKIRGLAYRAAGWFPISGLGLLCLAVVMPSLYFLALKQQDLVLLSLGCGYLVLHTTLLLLVLVRTAALLWHLRTQRAGFPHGAEAERVYTLPPPAPLWNWFPLVQVTCRWLGPTAVVELTATGERVTLARRGVYQEVVREWTVSDSLGLNRVRFTRTHRGEFQVIPALGRLHNQSLLVRWSSGDEISSPLGDPAGDRVDIRQYTRGDSPRTILWKVFARTRRLMVRVPERAVAAKPKVCAYLVTAPRDEAAAAVCRVILEGQMLGPDWRFGCDGAPGRDHQPEAALQRLCRSAQSVAPQPQQLAEYLRDAQQDGYGQAVVVLPLDLAGKAEQVRDVVSRSGVPVNVCLAIDGNPGPAVRNRWQKWLVQGGQEQKLAEELTRAAEVWKHFSGSVTLVDRRLGTMLGDLKSLARRSA